MQHRKRNFICLTSWPKHLLIAKKANEALKTDFISPHNVILIKDLNQKGLSVKA